MFTVKYHNGDGSIQLISAETVTSAFTDDGLVVYAHKGISRNAIGPIPKSEEGAREGVPVYVMNDHGATVETFRL